MGSQERPNSKSPGTKFLLHRPACFVDVRLIHLAIASISLLRGCYVSVYQKVNLIENPMKPSCSYGFPEVFLWFSYGFPMVLLWFTPASFARPRPKALVGCQNFRP